jgi:hypothetical protein
MTNEIFNSCVALLVWLAALTGTTYEEINVLVFCIVWPLVTLALVVVCVMRGLKIRRLEKQVQDETIARHRDRVHIVPI